MQQSWKDSPRSARIQPMARKWILTVLGLAALLIALMGYHIFVVHRSAEHFRLLLESHRVEEKKLHYEEIYRYYHPWNPYQERAERWLQEEGHEWEYLRKERS